MNSKSVLWQPQWRQSQVPSDWSICRLASLAILQVINIADAPLRLPFGRDAIRRIEAKNAVVTKELARWRELAAINGHQRMMLRSRSWPTHAATY